MQPDDLTQVIAAVGSLVTALGGWAAAMAVGVRRMVRDAREHVAVPADVEWERDRAEYQQALAQEQANKTRSDIVRGGLGITGRTIRSS